MDSAALLDLLGNDNRRRILQLLARKPCYVTEISEAIDVSPKAVIEHLRKLEEAGLVESRAAEGRRKYFSIAQNLRLEVNVAPHEFGAKSAYARSCTVDITTCRHVTLDVRTDDRETPADVAAELDRLREVERELSMAQRWVRGRVAETMASVDDALEDGDGTQLHADLLVALREGPADVAQLAERVEAPTPVVEEALVTLRDAELAERAEEGWRVVGRERVRGPE